MDWICSVIANVDGLSTQVDLFVVFDIGEDIVEIVSQPIKGDYVKCCNLVELLTHDQDICRERNVEKH